MDVKPCKRCNLTEVVVVGKIDGSVVYRVTCRCRFTNDFQDIKDAYKAWADLEDQERIVIDYDALGKLLSGGVFYDESGVRVCLQHLGDDLLIKLLARTLSNRMLDKNPIDVAEPDHYCGGS